MLQKICDTAFVPNIYKSVHESRIKYTDPIQNDQITPLLGEISCPLHSSLPSLVSS